ncbi:MAG TPA: hypothetical protein VNH41_10190 [Steroidobacteraceae bacterium]|nr:hypothetical protein [Steroidobacteraceae bacterium]
MASRQRYIVVERWGEFQHYKDRDPTWIKNYLRLLRDDNYMELTGHQRAVLHGIWLLYASSGAQLRLDTRSLTRQLGLRVASHHLEALKKAGFIRVSASKTGARPEPRLEKEKENPQPPLRETEPLELQRVVANGVTAWKVA